MNKSIYHKFFFPHPADVVWEYLTKPELIAQWLMENDFAPVIGHEFQFRTRPMPNLRFDGIVYCTVLQVIPCKKLSYSWKGGPEKGTITLDSVVDWTLVPRDNGTELILEHSGISGTENVSMYAIMNEGWLKNIHKIATQINNAVNDKKST